MRATTARILSWAVMPVLVAILLPAGCRVSREPEPGEELAGPLAFRIENATASIANITIAPGGSAETGAGEASTGEAASEAAAGDTASRLIAQEDLASSATVRVGPYAQSEGELLCGQEVVISVTVEDENTTAVLLEGSGAGTPGFDEGSLGLSGERTLLYDDHYGCGDTVVVRVVDDGTGVGGSTSSTAVGEVRVYAAGQVPPDFDAEAPPAGDDEEPTPEPAAVNVTMANRTDSPIEVEFQVDSDTDEPGELIKVRNVDTKRNRQGHS